jgi:hypothetical protein
MENGISVEELDRLWSPPELETALDSYSVKKLESVAIEMYNTRDHGRRHQYLRRAMTKRCEKINQNFTWTDKYRQNVIQLNENMFHVFKKAYDEAVSLSDDIEKRIERGGAFGSGLSMAIVMEPEFNPDWRGKDRGMEEILLNAGEYSQFARINEKIKDVIAYDFEFSPESYLDKSCTWDQERIFGSVFNGISLNFAFCDLISDGKWSFKDIVSIERVSATVRLDWYFWQEHEVKQE